MRPTRRTSVALAAAALLAAPLAACETSSWSADCDAAGACSVEISGTKFYDFPVPYNAADGTRSADRIRLVEATEGGEAVIQAGDVEGRCAQGESFVVADTTITCDVVGDTRVELSTVRA